MATTNFAQASYQEVIDLHTEANTVSIVGLHTPRGDAPYEMLGGFFEQFQKFAYKGCSFSLVPAARLPADPLQVSISSGEATIDPRDMLNPLMFKGCHGNDLNTILNTLYNQSLGYGSNTTMFANRQGSDSMEFTALASGNTVSSAAQNMYYAALTDNTWLKAHPQAGLRKSGLRPLVYSLASNVPLQNGAFANGTLSPMAGPFSDTGTDTSAVGDGNLGVSGTYDDVASSPAGIEIGSSPSVPSYYLDGSAVHASPMWGHAGQGMFTPRLQRLGWLDTKTYVVPESISESDNVVTNGDDALWTDATMNRVTARLPLVYMGMLMLPPAYKTEQYYRLVINHQFQFKGFRGISGFDSEDFANATYFNFN